MKVANIGENISDKVVVCLGYFGCLHIGHMRIIDKAKAIAENLGGKVALVTFSNSPKVYFGRGKKTIFTLEERLKIFADAGIDYVITMPFDKAVAQTCGVDFLNAISRYKPLSIVCGSDYTFGCDRLTPKDIKSYLPSVCVEVVDELFYRETKVSTVNIEAMLCEGKVDEVNKMLSEPYFILGKVVRGREIGHTIGFPTANVLVGDEKLLPCGVFVADATVFGKTYRAIVNIGNKPTFGDESSTIEAHLIGFEGDLYGRDIALVIRRFLRATKPFDSVEELVKQLQIDKENAVSD